MDVKKLEKQEAKLRAKIEKRARRDLYEGSKLLDQYKKQVRTIYLVFVLLWLIMALAIVRRDVYADQPARLRRSCQKQVQGHPSADYRCQFRVSAYIVSLTQVD